MTALPPVVDAGTWQRELDTLRVREKAATRELDAIAAQRRRLPMVKMPAYTLEGERGPIRLADVFDGASQLIVYNHMWFPGETWHCPGCTGFTSQFTRLDFLNSYDARFVVVTQGPIDEALAYKRRVGNKMTWYSTANSPFGTDVGAPPDGGFAVNVFLRDGDTVYRTWHTDGRGTEQLTHTFGLIDLLPYGRQEEWQDSPEGWPKSPTGSGWGRSEDVARLYGPDAAVLHLGADHPADAVRWMGAAIDARYRGDLEGPPRAHAEFGEGRLAFTAGRLRGLWFGYRSCDSLPGEQVVVVHGDRSGRVRVIAIGNEAPAVTARALASTRAPS